MGMGKGPVGPDFTNIGVVPVMVTTPFKSTGVSEESESLPSGPTYRQVDCSRGPTHAGPPGQGHPQHSFCGRPWVELKQHGNVSRFQFNTSCQCGSNSARRAANHAHSIALSADSADQRAAAEQTFGAGGAAGSAPRCRAAPRRACEPTPELPRPPPNPPRLRAGRAPPSGGDPPQTRAQSRPLWERALSGPSLGNSTAPTPGPPPPFHSPFPRPQGPLPTPQEDRLSSEERRPPPPQRRRRIRQRIPPPGTVTGPPFPGV
jgi:hypothetical protein